MKAAIKHNIYKIYVMLFLGDAIKSAIYAKSRVAISNVKSLAAA
jgi:hypothetical protein